MSIEYSTTVYSFVIKGLSSKEDIKNFVNIFDLDYSISKSYICDLSYTVTMSGSQLKDIEKLIKLYNFIEEYSNHDSVDKKSYILYKPTLIEQWNKLNI